MKRITPLCFLLAAASLVAAKRATVIDGSAAVVRKQVCGGPGALEEQGAVARLRELDAFFAITPSGHVVRVEMTKERAHATQELDLSFLANLRDLEDLRIIDLPITPHALDALPRLKHLARLDLSGHSVGDAHLAIIGKMRQLRELGLRNTSITAPGAAPLANLRDLEVLTLSGTEMNDAVLCNISGLDELRRSKNRGHPCRNCAALVHGLPCSRPTPIGKSVKSGQMAARFIAYY
jgi:hypothetical protein